MVLIPSTVLDRKDLENCMMYKSAENEGSRSTSKAASTGCVHLWDENSPIDELEQACFTLQYTKQDMEEEYLMQVSSERRPVLVAILFFDVANVAIRHIAIAVTQNIAFATLLSSFSRKLSLLALVYTPVLLLNARSLFGVRRSPAVEEVMIICLVSLVLSALIIGVGPFQLDLTFAAFFFIATTSVLKIRWFLGTTALALPTCLALYETYFKLSCENASTCSTMGDDALHLLAAWAVGGLMSFLTDSNRRLAYSNHQRAIVHASKEVEEATARLEAERLLVAAQSQATARASIVARERAAGEAKSKLMGLLCHEVRTPLNACLASAEMLLETDLTDDQRELARTIRISGSILLSTVSSFLDFFKLEAGYQLDVGRTKLDLHELVHDVHCIIEAMIGRECSIRLPPPELVDGVPLEIVGDAHRLAGILLNLYSNAAKYTKRGCVSLRVEVVADGFRPRPENVAAFYENALGKDTGVGDEPTGFSSSPLIAAAAAWDEKTRALLGDGQKTSVSEHDSAQSMQAQAENSEMDDIPALSRTLSLMSCVDEGGGWTGAFSAVEKTVRPPPKQWLAFQVRDTGVGVSSAALSSLFEDFIQGSIAEVGRRRTQGSTGLGLSICSKQVSVLGGAIGALSKPGRGSVFWFTVPLNAVPPATDGGGEDDVHRRSMDVKPSDGEEALTVRWGGSHVPTTRLSKVPSSGNLEGGHALKGLRVLLAEDDVINRAVAQRVLAALGATCTVACDGAEAVAHIRAGDMFDVILMDMCMPVLNGVAAARSIRDLGCNVPIVAMTANVSDADRSDCLEAGMDGFLSKPVLKEQLTSAVLKVLLP